MPYYHVQIARKTVERSNFEMDLSQEKLQEYIVEPYHKGEEFFCGGVRIDPFDVKYIRISKTDMSFKELKPIVEKRADFTYMVGAKYYVVDEGENVTRAFIKHIPRKEVKKTDIIPESLSKKAFIVHGRDEKQALLLQKYLKDKLKVDAVMFDDLPDKGRTIIEQPEYIRDNVDYAFVIATPDDVGCLTEDIEEAGKMVVGLESVKAETVGRIFELFHTRARQNVVFEFGLFMGALGREKVCCLLKKDTEERPSDIDGILYKQFNKSVSEIFHEIPEELREAGYEI